MAALDDFWRIISSLSRPDDYTIRIGLEDIGFGLVGGEFFEVFGVEGTTLYHNKKFPTTRVSDDFVDIDFSVFNLTAPQITGTVKGMVRVYQPRSYCDGAMRISFNTQAAASITSTGSTDSNFVIDNVLNSNRSRTHKLNTGAQQITATMSERALVDMVGLIDIKCSLSSQIRIRAESANPLFPVEVALPAISPRFLLSERPKLAYQGITASGHNLADLVSHFIGYIPPAMPSSVKVDFLTSTAEVEFSELLICSYYTPQAAKNHNFDSQVAHSIAGQLTQRGDVTHLKYDGRHSDLSFLLEFMDGYDRTYLDLMSKSERTAVVDLYPDKYGQRFENMMVGLFTGKIPITNAETGGMTQMKMASTKLHPGLQYG